MNFETMHYQRIVDVAKKIESGELSPVDLTRQMLERIRLLDPQLKSYATVTQEVALRDAAQAEAEIAAGRYRGVLHGIPIAVKDLCYTQGIRTMGGLAVLKDFIPTYDATVTKRLQDCGAVLLGKLNLTEGAMVGYHRDFDIPVNPWGSDLWPGLSSSGSGVATAAGLCFSALGTDTGGSIRFPAMANGVVGLKPTYGRVSRHGVLDLAPSLDHVGPLSRCVEDAAIMLRAISGLDPADTTSLDVPAPDFSDIRAGIEGLTIGYDAGYAAQGTDAELIASIEIALKILSELGANIVAVEMPEDILTVPEIWFPICGYEAHKVHSETYPSRRADYGGYFGGFLEIGAAITDAQYAQAMLARQAFSANYQALLETVDALVCPAGGVAFPMPVSQYGNAEELAPVFAAVQLHFVMPDDLAGTPTLTLPCGVASSGASHSLQLVGSRLTESMLCRIGHAYESATDWKERHPPV
jgi:amidase